MSATHAMSFYSEKSYERPMRCNFQELSALLLQQWHKLSRLELEQTGFIKRQIARLIERKYGIHTNITENYLSNLERTLPLPA